MKLDENAWAILKEDEKMVLNLQHGHDKSSWQAGEIMDKAHYKLLEIKYRAERFLKMFTTYFSLYDELIPGHLGIPKDIGIFLEHTITHRKTLKEAYTEMSSTIADFDKKGFEKSLIEFILKWSKSDKLEKANFANMVSEFDRWNNFRILPKEIQEPSAYKRRNKNVHKKHLKILCNLSPLALDILNKVLFQKNRTGLYVVLLEKGKTPIIKNLRKKLTLKATEFGLYIWTEEEQAKNHLKITEPYVKNLKKGSRDGLEFWPNYMESIKKAQNYMELQNIKPTRKFLELAVEKLEFY